MQPPEFYLMGGSSLGIHFLKLKLETNMYRSGNKKGQLFHQMVNKKGPWIHAIITVRK